MQHTAQSPFLTLFVPGVIKVFAVCTVAKTPAANPQHSFAPISSVAAEGNMAGSSSNFQLGAASPSVVVGDPIPQGGSSGSRPPSWFTLEAHKIRAAFYKPEAQRLLKRFQSDPHLPAKLKEIGGFENELCADALEKGFFLHATSSILPAQAFLKEQLLAGISLTLNLHDREQETRQMWFLH